MPRPRSWHPIPARSLERPVYGRNIVVLHHVSGALLLHRKFVSRNSPYYHRCGLWLVVVDRTVLRCRSYNAKQVNRPPTRWANQVLRRHADGTEAQERAEQQREQDELFAQRATSDRWDGDVDHAVAAAQSKAATTIGSPSDARAREQVNRADNEGDRLRWFPAQVDELPRSLNPMCKPFTDRGRLRKLRAEKRAKDLRAVARRQKASADLAVPAYLRVRHLLPR